MGLIEWVLLWVCGFFYGGLHWIYGGLRWWVCICSGFCFFSFFHFTFPQTLENIFQTIFQNAIKHRKTIIFPEIIYICKHFMVKNVLRRNKRSLNVIFAYNCIPPICSH